LKQEDLEKILAKPGYAVASSFRKPIQTSLGKATVRSGISGAGATSDMERVSGHESLPTERVALNYTGRVRVGIKFYRRRLADYSRANCEKFVIDAARYAGLLLDDSEAHMDLCDEGQVKVESEQQERIELTFTYESVDFDNLWVRHHRQDGR